MCLYELDGVVKKYGDRTIVNVKKLNINKNKIYAVLGPNGAGKSTLLRLLNLLERPDHGSLKFLGQEVNTAGRRLDIVRQMCMVFQKPHMFRATVLENVAYGLKLRGKSTGEIKKLSEEMLSVVGLSHFSKSPAYKLSGGESQRVAIARALVLRPKLLLLDEPTSNLDPNNVNIIEDIIRFSQREYGMTVIIVTHNFFQAKRLSDETLLLLDGKVIEKNNTPDFFNNPQDERTKGFLDGTMVY
ncbi:MAG: tungsten ABC transporter ATP-binding protein [Peptococcaceae bacterium BICA1-8]|nr:MAG: tungsten ABC transporter ATP-binding protein [Peptococcaceae bacterium BICA1-8]